MNAENNDIIIKGIPLSITPSLRFDSYMVKVTYAPYSPFLVGKTVTVDLPKEIRENIGIEIGVKFLPGVIYAIAGILEEIEITGFSDMRPSDCGLPSIVKLNDIGAMFAFQVSGVDITVRDKLERNQEIPLWLSPARHMERHMRRLVRFERQSSNISLEDVRKMINSKEIIAMETKQHEEKAQKVSKEFISVRDLHGMQKEQNTCSNAGEKRSIAMEGYKHKNTCGLCVLNENCNSAHSTMLSSIDESTDREIRELEERCAQEAVKEIKDNAIPNYFGRLIYSYENFIPEETHNSRMSYAGLFVKKFTGSVTLVPGILPLFDPDTNILTCIEVCGLTKDAFRLLYHAIGQGRSPAVYIRMSAEAYNIRRTVRNGLEEVHVRNADGTPMTPDRIIICESVQGHAETGTFVRSQPNKKTIAAMLEAERIAHDPNVKRYSDAEKALRELKR